MLPEKIGEYKILGSLGSGTFGDVYKVEKDGKLYALKHIVLGSKVDNVILQLEVDSHGSIPKHENIVGFVDYFKSWYRWNIVLEFCELGTLESYLVHTNPEKKEILSFMLDMASGLNHLHTNNIVHRDIKPLNVLLVKNTSDIPKCKISDFGVARFISERPGNMQLGDGDPSEEKYFQTLRGTPYFVAPEVRRGQYTKSCDIFSLGIVYYLMFAREVSSEKHLMPYVRGGTPFYKATEPQIKNQIDLYVHDDMINHLICSMMTIDLHCRISAQELEDELRDKYTTFRRLSRQNNVLNILSIVKEQLEKLEQEGYSALCMWYDVLGENTQDPNPGYKNVGASLPPSEINHFLNRYTGIVESKTDNENLDCHSETSDCPEALSLYPSDEFSTCSMSTQSSPFEPETYNVAVNTSSPTTTTIACQTDTEPAGSLTGGSTMDASQCLPSTITLSGLSGLTLTCPGSITLSSPAGITLSSPAGLSLASLLGQAQVSQDVPPAVVTSTESEIPANKKASARSETSTSVSDASPAARPRVSSTSSVHETPSTKLSQSKTPNSVRKSTPNIGRSSSFAAGRKSSIAGKGSSLERSSSSASSKKPTSPVTRTRSSPAVAHSTSTSKTITSPKPQRRTSPHPTHPPHHPNHPHPSSTKSKAPSSPTARKNSLSHPATSDTTHAAAHSHTPSVSVKSPTLQKKKTPSPSPGRKKSTTPKSSHNLTNASSHNQTATSSQPQAKTSSQTSVNTPSNPPGKPTPSTSQTSPALHASQGSPTSPPSPASTKKKVHPPSPKTTPKTSTTPKPAVSTPPKKADEESKGSVFGRLFRWK